MTINYGFKRSYLQFDIYVIFYLLLQLYYSSFTLFFKLLHHCHARVNIFLCNTRNISSIIINLIIKLL